MRTNEQEGMLMRRLFLLAALFVASIGAAKEGESPQVAAEHLSDALRSEESVSFYFVSRTGNYSFRGERFKKEANTVIFRRCGSNCHNFMSDVITHLGSATAATCPKGQENLLIETSNGLAILYSYSGRSIEFEGKCYFNEKGIDRTIKNARFLFN